MKKPNTPPAQPRADTGFSYSRPYFEELVDTALAHAKKLGATDAVPETMEASLQLSEAALVDIGVPMGLVIASIHEQRDIYRKALLAEESPAVAPHPFSARRWRKPTR